MDEEGRNAFSFLLNSHHRMFARAKLTTKDTSDRGRAKLVRKATAVAMEALSAQIRDEREARPKAKSPVSRKPPAGPVEDFESGLPAGKDRGGIEIGFLTVRDPESTVRISTAAPPTRVPSQRLATASLKLDFDAPGWAAFLHKFETDAVDEWVASDWSGYDQLSFWLYGRNTGTLLFVDVLDNRKPPFSNDDAEVYVYNFNDDVSGWRRVRIRFEDMHRKEVGNGAPVDGLGLSAVHGWAFGAVNTARPVTFYIDDVELERAAPRKQGAPPTGE